MKLTLRSFAVSLLLPCLAFGSPTTVSFLCRMEDGSNTNLITPTILTNASLGGGTWTFPNTNTLVTVSTAQFSDIPGLQVSGGGGNGVTGTRSMRVDCAADFEYAEMTITSDAKLSMGMAVYIEGAFSGDHYASIDLFTFRGGGDNCVFNIYDAPAADAAAGMLMESGGGSSAIIPGTKTNGQWYWVTMLYDGPNSLSTIKVYTVSGQPSTWTLLGTGTHSNTNTAHTIIRWGRSDNHAQVSSAKVYMDNLCIDYAGAFPLLPGDVAPGTITATTVNAANFNVPGP